ncbi:universal stress protein [Streptomyces sp. NPDC059460]|uniref:universal stress protein n=1 Tax=Streptomyces sp. NPDC059460 TaxID=3346840 RepID=UPI0036C32684
MNSSDSSDQDGPVLGALVAGVDGSEHAKRAVLWASGETVRRNHPLHLVYAADTDTRLLYASMETIEQIRHAGAELLWEIAATVSERYPGLKVTKELSRREPVVSDEEVALQAQRRLLPETAADLSPKYPDVALTHEAPVGHPVDELAQAAEHALALVVGSRGRGGYTSMRIGSVVHGLLHRAHCPVIAVPAV